MFYGSSSFNPKLIVGQILLMQILFYLSLIFVIWFFDAILGHMVSFNQIYSPQQTNIKTVLGWITIISYISNSFIGGVFLLKIVQRAKKCLDFTSTIYIFHFIICTIYSKSFPTCWEWWITNIVSLIIMSVFGEYLCMKKELQEIPLPSLRNHFGNSEESGQEQEDKPFQPSANKVLEV